MKKAYVDKNGYKRGEIEHSDLIHRQIAYKEIYLKRKDEFPKPFSLYQIHHIDHNKQNNDVSNLMLLSKEDHEKIHQIYVDNPEKLTDWEVKKIKANVGGDFSQTRLLIGNKITDIMVLTTKWFFSISISLFVVCVFTYGFFPKETVILGILIIFIYVSVIILILSILANLLCGTIGWIYNHFGNLVDETNKRFKK